MFKRNFNSSKTILVLAVETKAKSSWIFISQIAKSN